MSKIEAPGSTGITRRAVLGGALAAGAAIATGPLQAQRLQTHMPPGVAPKAKGPLVFLDYDKEELDTAYNQIPWAPNRAEVSKRTAQRSAAARARLAASPMARQRSRSSTSTPRDRRMLR